MCRSPVLVILYPVLLYSPLHPSDTTTHPQYYCTHLLVLPHSSISTTNLLVPLHSSTMSTGTTTLIVHSSVSTTALSCQCYCTLTLALLFSSPNTSVLATLHLLYYAQHSSTSTLISWYKCTQLPVQAYSPPGTRPWVWGTVVWDAAPCLYWEATCSRSLWRSVQGLPSYCYCTRRLAGVTMKERVYSETCLNKSLPWSDHLAWKTTYSWQKV